MLKLYLRVWVKNMPEKESESQTKEYNIEPIDKADLPISLRENVYTKIANDLKGKPKGLYKVNRDKNVKVLSIVSGLKKALKDVKNARVFQRNKQAFVELS